MTCPIGCPLASFSDGRKSAGHADFRELRATTVIRLIRMSFRCRVGGRR